MNQNENKMEITNEGHRDRLRNRYLNAGIDSFQDYERLELLLMYAIPRRDVKPIAKKLLARYKTLSAVIDAPLEQLEKITGMGRNSALLCKLLKDLCTQYLKENMCEADVLANPTRVINYSRAKLGSMDVEAMLVIYLNVKNMVISSEVFHGTVDQTSVYPRNLMQTALRHNASGIILVHNHPSGICQPSPEDELLTMNIQEAGKTMGVKIIDHIIVSRSSHYSFVAEGKL